MPLELNPTAIAPAGTEAAGTSRFRLGFGRARKARRLTAGDRMFFTEQLALLLETGTDLRASLQTLARQSDDPAMTGLLESLGNDISEGKPFSQALSCHPDLFSRSYVALIAASEQGGFMNKVLQQLQELEEKRAQLRHSLTSALSYPAFLVAFSIAVVVFVLAVVFPKFAAMFALIHNQLPLTTRLLMKASDMVVNHWVVLTASVAAAILGIHYWARTPAGRDAIDRFKLDGPLVREIFVPLYLAQLLRLVSVSLANGVPLMDALRASKDVVENVAFRRFLGRVEGSIEAGSGIAAGFERETFVPVLVKQMVATGEATGSLAKVMSRVADYYERELGKKVALISRLAEPVMLLVMGVVVGLLVSSLILPIFKLSRVAG